MAARQVWSGYRSCRLAPKSGRKVSVFPGNIAYVWHAALRSTIVAESLLSEKFSIRAQIIWAKERLVIGRGDYQWQHEPCWYAVRSKGNWTGDRKQTTLWTISSGGQDTETIHGTHKPVECMRRPMLNNSDVGQAVYEPFLGSGTTLIAAETIGRICYAIEVDPLYVDVAVRRWQAFTGLSANLLGVGQTFDESAAVRGTRHTSETGTDDKALTGAVPNPAHAAKPATRNAGKTRRRKQ